MSKTLSIGGKTVSNITIATKEVKSISIDGTVVWSKEEEEPDYFYLENVYTGSNDIYVGANVNSVPTTLQYSTDGINFNNLHFNAGTGTSDVVNLNNYGDKVYFRSYDGVCAIGNPYNIYFWSYSKHPYNAGGNLATLVDYTNVNNVTSGDFSYLFGHHTVIKELADCSELTFGNIATVKCQGMFENCPNITTAPNMSSVAKINNDGCSSMFAGCESLTTGPNLRSVTIIGTDGCRYMFYNCQSLNYVTAPNVQTWDIDDMTSDTSHWLSNVAATGVVSKPASLEIPTDSTSGIPTGWTTVNY